MCQVLQQGDRTYLRTSLSMFSDQLQQLRVSLTRCVCVCLALCAVCLSLLLAVCVCAVCVSVCLYDMIRNTTNP
jgi:hypothetical protein